MAKISDEILGHLDGLWCEYVTGEPLPETNGEADQVRTILWQTAQAAYLKALEELGFHRDLQIEQSWREPGLSADEVSQRQLKLVEKYAQRLCELRSIQYQSLSILKQLERMLKSQDEDVALAVLLNRGGLTIAGADKAGYGTLYGLVVTLASGTRYYQDVISNFLVLGQTTDLGHEVYLHQVEPVDHSCPSFLIELPIVEHVINVLLDAIENEEGCRIKEKMWAGAVEIDYEAIARILCPTITQALAHSVVVELRDRWEHAGDEMYSIYAIFHTGISTREWRAAMSLPPALQQTLIQNSAAIRNAIYRGKNLPPNLPAEVVELVRSYRDKLLAAGPRGWQTLPQDLQQALMDSYLAGEEH